MKNFWLINLCVRLSEVFKFSISSSLSILGLSVGVGTLLVALSLVDAYEESYKESVYSVYSHAIITPLSSEEKLDKVKEDVTQALKSSQFVISPLSRQEGLLATKGKVAGVNIEGVDPKTILDVINLKNKITQGSYLIDDKVKNPYVLVGKGLAYKFDLKPEDVFAVVIPIKKTQADEQLSRKVFTFKVGGVIDYGSHFVNKRNIVVHRSVVSRMVGVSEEFFSAVRIKIDNDQNVASFVNSFRDQFQDRYWLRSWSEAAGGLLKVIKFEKTIIFLIVLILALVASFNVSTNLFLNLVKKTREISVLLAIGMTRKQVRTLFILNGVFVAVSGVFFGTILALLVMSLVNYILKSGLFVPPEVYKLTSITLTLSWEVFLSVLFAALLLCFFASLAPARTIKDFSIIKGLRYE